MKSEVGLDQQESADINGDERSRSNPVPSSDHRLLCGFHVKSYSKSLTQTSQVKLWSQIQCRHTLEALCRFVGLALILSLFLLGVSFHNTQGTHQADKDWDHLYSCRKRNGQVGAAQLTSSSPLSMCRGGIHSPSAHSLCVWVAGSLCK